GALKPFDSLFVVEDHAPIGGLGDALRRELQRAVTVLGVGGWPACGTPVEALRAHGLDGASLADRIACSRSGPPTQAMAARCSAAVPASAGPRRARKTARCQPVYHE